MGEIIALKSCKDCIHVDVCRYRTDPGSKNCVFKHSAADVRPAVRGKWLKYHHSYFGMHQCVCSECKNDDYWKKYFCYGHERFCPNCGADMRGGTEQ